MMIFFFFFRFQSALLLLRTTADTKQRGREFFVRDALRDFLLCLTSPLFLSLSLSLFLSFAVSKTQALGCWVFSSTNEKKKKEESLARTHTRVVPIAHSHESSVTHLRSPQICCDFTKKNRKKRTQKKHTHIIPKSLSGSLPTKKRRL